VKRLVVASGTYDPGIVLALGEGDTIAGSNDPPSEWWHPEILKLYAEGQIHFVGYWNAMDYEAIKLLNPDLVLSSSIEAQETLESFGFAVAGTYDPALNSIENRVMLINFLGAAYEKEEIAKKMGKVVQETVKSIKKRAEGHPKPITGWGVYYGKRVYALRGNFWMAELITAAGADYVFSDLESDAMEIALEAFITKTKDAELFFANPIYEYEVKTKRDMVAYHPDLATLKAFGPEGRVVVPKALTWQDTGNLAEIALDVAAVIHPELYPDREITYFYFLED
jgi:iron complex transport system substrate-binding protein